MLERTALSSNIDPNILQALNELDPTGGKQMKHDLNDDVSDSCLLPKDVQGTLKVSEVQAPKAA